MAQKDWRRYYVPVFASGIISPYCFLSREQLQKSMIKRLRLSDDKLIGILAVKGKDWKTQNELWSYSI